MFNSLKYNKVLTVVISIALVTIFLVIGFWGYDVYKRNKTKKNAQDVVNEFDNQISQQMIKGRGEGNLEQNTNIDINDIINNQNTTNETSDSNIARVTYKGFTMLGKIEIPKINLKLPVLDRATASSMEVSVGVAYGPGLNKVGNTVIMGHNYRDGTFFSNLYKVELNDLIYITDNTGERIKYTVYNVYETPASDISYASRDTAGKREISLSTCTDDVQNRIIIWARED